MTKEKEIISVKPRRDEAAVYFRKFARLGLDRRTLSPFDVYGVIRGVSANEVEALRLLAVYDTLRLLDLTDTEALDAVRSVYLADRGRNPKRNQTSERVLRFATDNHLDERTVYRRLKAAKDLYYHLLRG